MDKEKKKRVNQRRLEEKKRNVLYLISHDMNVIGSYAPRKDTHTHTEKERERERETDREGLTKCFLVLYDYVIIFIWN